MASQNSNATGTTTRTIRLQFFCTHGPLSPERQGYIRRSSDEAAFAALQAGRFVDVTGSPLTGKTSLLLRVADRLRAAEDEPLVAFIDVRQLLQRDSNEDVARWFYAIAYRLARQLRVGFDLQTWWADNAMLSHHHRLVELYRELVLALPRRRIVVLFDDVHEFAARDSAEALLTSFRSAHDARASDPEMNRLTIGYAHNGVRRFGREHLQHLPYAIATHVAVVPMRLADTLKLAPALGLPRDQGELAMQRIFDWVSGHPAMTQWLAAELAQVLTDDGDAVATVDAIVARRLNKTAGAPAHEAIARIERRILRARESLREAILLTLGRLAKNGRLLFDPASKAHDRLLLLGVLELGPDGYLLFSSRIFRRYFGARWASRHLPTRIRGVVRAVAVVLLCTTIPAWYFMVLPQRPTAILMDTNAAVEDVVRAADRLGFWPGYRGAATRMVRFALLQRLQEIQSAEELAALLAPVQARLNDSALIDELTLLFWQRQLNAAELDGDRAAAVRAVLQLLGVADTPERRRILAGLIGSDLPRLTGVLRDEAPFDAIFFRPRDRALLTQTGIRFDEWLPDSTGIWGKQRTLVPQAFTLQPEVVRLDLPAVNDVRRLQLRVRLTHTRAADLRIVVTSPTGRRIATDAKALLIEANQLDVLLGDVDSLAVLRGAEPAGEWSVTIVDTRPGMLGQATVLGLGDATVSGVDTLVLSDPVPVSPASTMLDPGGRFALALPAEQNQVGAIWDMRMRQLVSPLPVTADAQVVGFASNGSEVIIQDGLSLVAFQLGDGRALPRKVFEKQVDAAWLDQSGRWLAARRVTAGEDIAVLDLVEDQVLATVNVGAVPLALAVSADGQFIATAGDDQVVRVRSVQSGELIGVASSEAAISAVRFVEATDVLLVRTADGGMLSWRFELGEAPVNWDYASAWTYASDPQSGLSFVGSVSEGYRLHDFSERQDRSLPILGFESQAAGAALLRVRDRLAVIAEPERGLATVWQPQLEALPTGSRRVREAWLGPDGETFAFSDARNAFAVLRLDAGIEEIGWLDDEVAAVTHATTPTLLKFSSTEGHVLSLEANGLYRIHAGTGGLLPYIGRSGRGVVDAAFDQDATYLLFARGLELVVRSVADGATLATAVLETPAAAVVTRGEHAWLAVLRDGSVISVSLGEDEATLDLTRQAQLPIVPTLGAVSARGIAALAGGQQVTFVDIENSRVLARGMRLPAPVSEMVFSADGRHLVVRAGQWLHRVRVDSYSPVLVASRLLPADSVRYRGLALADADGLAVRMLAGLDEPIGTTVWLDYREVAETDTALSVLQARWALIDGL